MVWLLAGSIANTKVLPDRPPICCHVVLAITGKYNRTREINNAPQQSHFIRFIL